MPDLTPADRLALAVCRVARELARILRERHGGSSTVADWLDGLGCHPETVQTVQQL